MTDARPLVAVYADESCLGNGKEGANPGGAGVLLEYRHADGRITRRDLWVSEPATTNNRMALRSVSERAKAGDEVSHAKATGTAKDVSEARRDAVKDTNDANYKAAKERCDAMSGDAKTKCQNDVAAKFKK